MPLFRDPRGLDFSFSDWKDTGGDAPIEWRTESSNSVIVATAPITAKAGTRRTVSGVVTNAVGASADFEVVLEMVSSRQPLTDAETDVVEDAAGGVPTSIPVTANDTSHITSDPSLTVTGASITSGSGKIEFDEQSVTITPAEDFVGTLTARYSVQDATKDPGRVVDGSIRLDVKNKPSPPSAPFGGVPGDGQIRFEYRSGGNNGFPIEKREVIASAPGHSPVTQECPGTTCTITGLRNNVPWTLSVVEYNKLGPSEPSPQSAAYIPDVKPLAPGRPAVESRDQALMVRWLEAGFANEDNKGSPVTTYTVNLYDSSGKRIDTKNLEGSARQFEWTGLTNGKTYSFGIVATNNAGSSPESEHTVPEVPVGPPKGNADIDAIPEPTEHGGSFHVKVSRKTLEANGDPKMHLEIVPVVGGQERQGKVIAFPPDEGKKHAFQGFGHNEVKFRLYAQNRHSRRLVAETKKALISWSAPKIDVQNHPTFQDYGSPKYPNKIGFQFVMHSMKSLKERQEAGARLQYRLDGGDWTDLQPGEGVYLTEELVPGREYSGHVRMILTKAVGDQEISDMERVTGMVPMSADPKPIPLEEPRAFDKAHVVITRPQPSLEDTGGWAPGGYHVDSGIGPKVKQRDNGSILLKSGNSAFTLGWRGIKPGDKTQSTIPKVQSESYDIKDVSTVEYRAATKKLTVEINYADEGSECRVFDQDENLLDTITSANGRIYKSETYPQPGSTDDDPKPHEKFKVNCTINGNSGRWTWNNVERK